MQVEIETGEEEQIAESDGAEHRERDVQVDQVEARRADRHAKQDLNRHDGHPRPGRQAASSGAIAAAATTVRTPPSVISTAGRS